MKELKNKKAYAEIDFSINLSISYEDEHGEIVELEDIKALDFLETVGYDEFVMQKIWEDIADGCCWGLFDIVLDCGRWVSVYWSSDKNKFTVAYNDGDDWVDLRYNFYVDEFYDIFGDWIDEIASPDYKNWRYLCYYWETEIDLEYYPNILNKIEKAGA